MDFDVPLIETGARLAMATLLGGLVGWDREQRRKPAGLRTNMMVALGACTFTLMGIVLIAGLGQGDPTRVVTGVATGIGFLGAGSILKRGESVEGVTTAAGIWVVGAIGAACGAGAYGVAAVATAIALVVLYALGKLETKKDAAGND
jgi:putative Mg2+ transporter-C (MgtC) family protein